MKKPGFTLAEMLITLGIVGVIAAITIPTLMSDTQSAQVGPKLGKAAAAIQQANMNMLADLDVDSFSDAGINNYLQYQAQLSNYFKFGKISNPYSLAKANTTGYSAPNSGGSFPSFNSNSQIIAKDGSVYSIGTFNASSRGNVAPHQKSVGTMYIDVNGISGPNLIGSDVFAFRIMNDGSLDPLGSSSAAEASNNGKTWQEDCPNNSVPTDYFACTASIFENNMKVMYKMR